MHGGFFLSFCPSVCLSFPRPSLIPPSLSPWTVFPLTRRLGSPLAFSSFNKTCSLNLCLLTSYPCKYIQSSIYCFKIILKQQKGQHSAFQAGKKASPDESIRTWSKAEMKLQSPYMLNVIYCSDLKISHQNKLAAPAFPRV